MASPVLSSMSIVVPVSGLDVSALRARMFESAAVAIQPYKAKEQERRARVRAMTPVPTYTELHDPGLPGEAPGSCRVVLLGSSCANGGRRRRAK